MPAIRPPPPTGTKTASMRLGAWRRISTAIVPWPAMTSGSSKGWTKHALLGGADLAGVRVGVVVGVAVQHDSAAEGAHGVDLDRRRGRRHDDHRAMPSAPPASATPCAWLPAEAAMTPRRRCAASSWRILL